MIKLPQSAQEVIDKLKTNGFTAYAVGGSVRDLLMNKTTKAWDFTTDAPPEKILEIFPESFYDNQFGTVGLKVPPVENPQDIFEITTFRSEKGYTDNRHPDQVIWGKTLKEDLSRRDLTINAIAFDGVNLIDPYRGQQDLKNRLVRTVGDPNQRFQEDALRLIRAVRIATQLGFAIDSDTFTAIKNNAPLIKNISSDRVRHELLRIMESDWPADGIMILKNANLLSQILPEVEKCFGIPQQSPKRHHIYDVGTHLLKSLELCPSKNPLVRFATLLHDVGKPVVFRKDPQTQLITFYNHEIVGTNITKKIVTRLNFSKKDQEKIITLVRYHQFTVDEEQTDNTLRRFIKKVGKENLQDILDLRVGDRLGSGAKITSWRLKLYIKRLEEVQKQPFTVSDLKIDGFDVMKILNLKPGPRVGKILNDLFDQVVLGKIKNNRENLLEKLQD